MVEDQAAQTSGEYPANVKSTSKQVSSASVQDEGWLGESMEGPNETTLPAAATEDISAIRMALASSYNKQMGEGEETSSKLGTNLEVDFVQDADKNNDTTALAAGPKPSVGSTEAKSEIKMTQENKASLLDDEDLDWLADLPADTMGMYLTPLTEMILDGFASSTSNT
jgi:hypothetical protein